MRIAPIALLLTAFVLVGCNNKGPQTTEPLEPAPMDDSVTDIDVIEPDDTGDTAPAPLDENTGTTDTDTPLPDIEPAPEPDREPAGSTLPTEHEFAKGETLWRLAVKYYGDGQKWRLIARSNDIKDVKDIPIGKKLYIPKP